MAQYWAFQILHLQYLLLPNTSPIASRQPTQYRQYVCSFSFLYKHL